MVSHAEDFLLFSFVPSILKITERDFSMKLDMLNILFHTKYHGNLLYCNGLILNSYKKRKKNSNQHVLTKESIISSTVSWLKHLSSISILDKIA